MKNARRSPASLLAWAVILGASLPACRSVPITEVCLVGDVGCVCNDPRRPEGTQDYILTFEECQNFVARSPESEQILRRWALDNCRGK